MAQAQMQQSQLPQTLSSRRHALIQRSFKPARPAAAVHPQGRSSSKPLTDPQARSSSSCLQPWTQLAPAAVLLPLLTAGAAGADEAADAVYAAATNSGGPTDLVVTAMAGFVLVLLLLVTGGVAYLNLSSWLDDRQEKKDRETPVLTSSVASSAAAAEAEEAKKRVRVKREKRGFGDN